MSATTADVPRFGWPTKILFALGTASYGIKYRVLSVLLLIFYNQVMHMSAVVAASAIAAVTIWGSLLDPVVGQVSDNLRTRWGRRHPFMYAAALPMAVSFFALFNPPDGLSQVGLFSYLVICLFALRLFDTFYDLNSMALIPELIPDYHERTTLMGMREGASVTAGHLMMFLALQVFMKSTPEGGGIESRTGYFAFSLVCAGAIFLSIMIAALATHPQIPRLTQPPKRRVTLGEMMREIGLALTVRSFAVYIVAALVLALGTGVRGSLDVYFMRYFWGLPQSQMALITAASIPVSIGSTLVAPWVGRRVEKRTAAITAFVLTAAVALTPTMLRLSGVLPPNGDTAVFALVFAQALLVHFGLVATVLFCHSMLADVVEEVAVKTGRRSEGLVFASETMVKKLSSGVGTFVAGAVLTAVAFPKDVKVVGATPDTLHHLGMLYVPIFGGLYAVGAAMLCFYNISKRRHEDNLRTLDYRHEAAIAPAAGRLPLVGNGVDVNRIVG